MPQSLKCLRLFALLALGAVLLNAQIYSPKLLREGQPDSTDLKAFAEAIYAQANARTPRQKAEAIWRFFLTDGRFVKPGFWYHIAGWTYEEPSGEVLDPLKLLNSYGFGLCYHIAPLLEAVFDAGGFADARSWFLTGHTVAEVFYDGAYHYFDSDMMGYNVAGLGSFRGKPVVSVHQLELNGGIILGKLQSPKQVKPGVVDNPWYPADVRAGAMADLAALFTTSDNNYLYPFTRYSTGHTMDFVLRKGEKLIRFFKPETPGLFYLPYKFDGKTWTEFPQEIAEYHIRTADGPRSQKDDRLWATGRIEYIPASLPDQSVTIVDMPSPYVIIDARFTMQADLASSNSSIMLETSSDGGHSWQLAGKLLGPHSGSWSAQPKILVKSAHGRLTAVSGSYGYKVRITRTGGSSARFSQLRLVSRIQLNPRTLPAIEPGDNRFIFSAAPPVRRVAISTPLAGVPSRDLKLVNESGQQFLRPLNGKTGEVVYELQADGKPLTGFDVGVRFFDIQNGLVPDKLTAETRHTRAGDSEGPASISWSLSPNGPFRELWRFPQKLAWHDADPIERLLRWPEVFRQVRSLPPATSRVYVKFRTSGPAFDSLRLAVDTQEAAPSGRLSITQSWLEGTVLRQHVEHLNAATTNRSFTLRAGPNVSNQAVILSND